MRLKTIKPRICPNCLQFRREFVVCECETVLCSMCAIDFFTVEMCPSCYAEIPEIMWQAELKKSGVRS